MKSFSFAFSGLSLILVILVVIPLANMILSADPEIMKSTISDREVVASILLTLRAALWATLVCVIIYYTEPIWVPSSAQGEKLEAYRRLFEERLNQGTRWCDKYFGSERPWRKVKKKGIPEVGPL